jgi:RND superfamily putative drug exporter
MHTKLPSFTDMPNDIPAITAFHRLVRVFPGTPTPAQVVIRAPSVRDPAVAAAIRNLEQAAVATRQMFPPFSVDVSVDSTTALVEIPLAGNGDDAASQAALRTLREVVLPRTIGNMLGVSYAVTGQTAATHDWNEQMKARMPWVVAFVLALAFVLLLATFRSVVIPLTAIVLNLLSVGAAYGVLVVIFQNDWAEGLLGFTSNHAITSWLPTFLFVVLFGLSMDYHVFILSRVKELHDAGASTEDAIRLAITRTAGTVTSAAIIMVAVFGLFASLSLIMMQQLGFGLAVAVLLDATVVRAVLVPSAMKLLGEWNWYLPQRRPHRRVVARTRRATLRT